jgi:hypothetical protein
MRKTALGIRGISNRARQKGDGVLVFESLLKRAIPFRTLVAGSMIATAIL